MGLSLLLPSKLDQRIYVSSRYMVRELDPLYNFFLVTPLRDGRFRIGIGIGIGISDSDFDKQKFWNWNYFHERQCTFLFTF
jgi:hypothetical protein